MKATLTAKFPEKPVFVEEYEDGGGKVEIPILAPGVYDLSKTASKVNKTITVSENDLDSAVANFAEWAGPIPINVHPHRSFDETGERAPGFIRGMKLKGGKLWGVVSLCNWLYDEFKRGLWSGFSSDLAWGFKHPLKTFPGMSVFGGVFTNRPAGDITFDVRAAAGLSAEMAFSVALAFEVPGESASGEKDTTMSEEKVASLEAQITEKENQVAALEARNSELSQKVTMLEKGFTDLQGDFNRLRGEKSGVEGQLSVKTKEASDLTARLSTMEGEMAEMKAKFADVEKANLCQKLRRIRYEALDTRDIPAAFFLEMKEGKEADWLKDHFVSLEALEDVLKAFPQLKRRKSNSEKSGADHSEPDSLNMDPETKETLVRLGLDPKLAHITDETQLRK